MEKPAAGSRDASMDASLADGLASDTGMRIDILQEEVLTQMPGKAFARELKSP